MSDDNKLWDGHRLILSEMREQAVRRCAACRFFVQIRGAQEVRQGCVASVERYRRLWRLVPEEILLAEILAVVGRQGLPELLAHKGTDQACADFRPRL
jgi:hypothetical protein